MEEQLIVYRSYENFDRCEELTRLLNQNNIPFELEQYQKSQSDPFTGGYSGNLQFIVKLRQADFGRVNTLYESAPAEIAGHYFLQFSNQELEKVLIDSEEWSPGDIQVARLILLQRNAVPDENKLEILRMKKREEFYAPKKGNTLNILLAFGLPYFCIPVLILHAPLLFCYSFAFSGFAIGMNFKYNYRRDKEGTKFSYYDARTRQCGFFAVLHALLMGGVLICWGIASSFQHPLFRSEEPVHVYQNQWCTVQK